MFFKQLYTKGNYSIGVHLALIAIVIFSYIILSSIPLIALIFIKNPDNTLDALGLLAESYNNEGQIDWEALNITKNEGLIAMLISFLSISAPLILFYKSMHGRSPKVMFTAANKFRWKHFFLGVIIWGGMQTIGLTISYFQNPDIFEYQFQIEQFIPLFIIGLLLFPLQTGTEELLFRGYLMQAIGILTKYRWIALLLTSIGFALLHSFNPEVQKYGYGVMMSNYMAIGITLGIVTLMDDGLEIAFGAHFINNFFAATFLTFEGSALQTDAVFKLTEVDPSKETYLAIAGCVAFVFILKYLLKWKDWSKVFGTVSQPIDEDDGTNDVEHLVEI